MTKLTMLIRKSLVNRMLNSVINLRQLTQRRGKMVTTIDLSILPVRVILLILIQSIHNQGNNYYYFQ